MCFIRLATGDDINCIPTNRGVDPKLQWIFAFCECHHRCTYSLFWQIASAAATTTGSDRFFFSSQTLTIFLSGQFRFLTSSSLTHYIYNCVYSYNNKRLHRIKSDITGLSIISVHFHFVKFVTEQTKPLTPDCS